MGVELESVLNVSLLCFDTCFLPKQCPGELRDQRRSMDWSLRNTGVGDWKWLSGQSKETFNDF